MPEEDFEVVKEKILSTLILNEEQRKILELEIVGQYLSNKLIERRRKMLPASYFGKIIKLI